MSHLCHHPKDSLPVEMDLIGKISMRKKSETKNEKFVFYMMAPSSFTLILYPSSQINLIIKQ